MTTEPNTPPNHTQRIMRVADLPPDRGEARYAVTNDAGVETVCTLARRRRQIMDLLIAGPVFCASPVRLSDVVHLLKREIGLEVETRYFRGDEQTGSGTYGVYFLTSKVRRLAQQEEAA